MLKYPCFHFSVQQRAKPIFKTVIPIFFLKTTKSNFAFGLSTQFDEVVLRFLMESDDWTEPIPSICPGTWTSKSIWLEKAKAMKAGRPTLGSEGPNTGRFTSRIGKRKRSKWAFQVIFPDLITWRQAMALKTLDGNSPWPKETVKHAFMYMVFPGWVRLTVLSFHSFSGFPIPQNHGCLSSFCAPQSLINSLRTLASAAITSDRVHRNCIRVIR